MRRIRRFCVYCLSVVAAFSISVIPASHVAAQSRTRVIVVCEGRTEGFALLTQGTLANIFACGGNFDRVGVFEAVGYGDPNESPSPSTYSSATQMSSRI